jgi:hypothetical protein
MIIALCDDPGLYTEGTNFFVDLQDNVPKDLQCM